MALWSTSPITTTPSSKKDATSLLAIGRDDLSHRLHRHDITLCYGNIKVYSCVRRVFSFLLLILLMLYISLEWIVASIL